MANNVTRVPPTNQTDTIFVGPPETLSLVEQRRDNVREKIALRLTYMMITIVLIPIVTSIIFPDRAGAIKEIASSMLGPMVGIYGVVLGFYFGTRDLK